MTAAGTVRPVGDAGVLIEVEDHRAARALAAAVRRAAPSGVLEVVGGLRSVLVVFDPLVTDALACADHVRALEPEAEVGGGGRTLQLPVVLDGPDLDDVGAVTGLDTEAVGRLLESTLLEVAMIGFAPGFAYLVGLPEPLDRVPRRSRPRPRVPAGSLALAGGFAAVYPRSSPGGWHLVGRTAERMFDPDRPPFSRLHPGDRVRLRRVPAVPSVADDAARGPLRSVGEARWVVVEAGLQTTVQDAGRRGVAHLGVPSAGPADERALALANLLVGNPTGAPALEVTVRGPRLRCLAPCHVALVGRGDLGGEPPTLLLDGRPVPAATVVPVYAGQHLEVTSSGSGLRAYLAMDGGFAAHPVLESHAMDLFSGLGSGPLQAGDELSRWGAPGRLRSHLVARGPSGDRDGVHTLRVLTGPHAEWFDDGALDALAGQRHRVEDGSDRTGVRLRPERAPIPRRPRELDSQGMLRGAVQVPVDGCPVILGPDHATLGGYPVLAVVISADLWRLGQCRPGDVVEFAVVDRATAVEARRAETEVGGGVVGHYPAGVDQ